MNRSTDATLDIRDVQPSATRRDDHSAQMKQRYGSTPTDTEDALLDTKQPFFAIEDQRALERAEQAADPDHDDTTQRRPHRAKRHEPHTTGGQAPAGPRGRARQIELDATLRPLAYLYGAEPVEHCCKRTVFAG